MRDVTLPLLAWLSPAFPVGAYAYSHGLEWAVEVGDVRDAASLGAFVDDILRHGAGRNDAIFLGEAVRAAEQGDLPALIETNELALAYAPSRELLLETSQQGCSFLDAVRAAWPHPTLENAASALDGEVAYPVAVGAAVAAHGIPALLATAAYLLAFAQNLVSAATRLGVLGQTGAARLVAQLAPVAADLAEAAQAHTTADLGSATFRADLGSFRHETQYTRLFRS
jgi:urease accessory protein